MPADKTWCEQCGTLLPVDARFCEMCGAPIRQESQREVETVIGHLPVQRVQAGKGFLGRDQTTDLTLIITTSRLLFLREARETSDNWLAETERLMEEEHQSGLTWRELMDRYDWRRALWDVFFKTPPDELLATHRDNTAVPLEQVISVTVSLAEERDVVSILLADGESYQLRLFDQMGRPATRFLAQALGPQRVRLVSQPEE